MAKVDKKVQITIDGGVYDHETRTITVDMKDGYVEVPIDELFEKLDGYELKLTATMQLTED
jgi:hypothetical protein